MERIKRPYYVYLKLDLLHLDESVNGLVDCTDVYYIPVSWFDDPYDFSKDLPKNVRVYFKGSVVEPHPDVDSCIFTVKLPHLKPIKLSLLEEDEYPDRVFIEYIRNKLSLRFTLVCKTTELFDTIKVTKGKETLKFNIHDFDSARNVFRYPSSTELVPWLEGFQVVEFDDEKALIINPEKNINIQLDGEHQTVRYDDIRFNLSYSLLKIIELEPLTKKIRFYKVDAKLYEKSFYNKCSAYKLACSIAEQTPDALDIIQVYMQDAVLLKSKQAERWINEMHKNPRKLPPLRISKEKGKAKEDYRKKED